MPKNLVIITQRVDFEDDILGFFVAWIKEFAKHFDRVFVITLAKGKFDLPDNVEVHSLGKEEDTYRLMRLFTFYKLLFKFIPQSDGVFAHMSPVFAVMSWPVAVLFRKKIVLWYLHRSVTLRLRMAEKLCYKIVTSTRQSLGLRSSKIIETGHAIDTGYFKPAQNVREGAFNPVKILSVARISPAKRIEIFIETLKLLREDGLQFRAVIVGKAVMAGDREYLEKLKFQISNFKLNDHVVFEGFVPYSKITDYYNNADISVNLTNGGTDKVVLESMATGCITLTSNPAFKRYIGTLSEDIIFEYDNPADLARHIKHIVSLSPEEREKISESLVSSVAEYHQLSKTIGQISKLF